MPDSQGPVVTDNGGLILDWKFQPTEVRGYTDYGVCGFTLLFLGQRLVSDLLKALTDPR